MASFCSARGLPRDFFLTTHTMDFPDSFFFFSLFFFFFPGVRLRSSGTEFIMVTDSGPHNYSVFVFFVFGARTPLRSMSRASTAARHRGPRAAHPIHSAALGSSVQKSCFFSVTFATDSLCTGRSFRGAIESVHRPSAHGKICTSYQSQGKGKKGVDGSPSLCGA